jgi:hypothetical protein
MGIVGHFWPTETLRLPMILRLGLKAPLSGAKQKCLLLIENGAIDRFQTFDTVYPRHFRSSGSTRYDALY